MHIRRVTEWLPWASTVIRREPPVDTGTTAALYNDETPLVSYPRQAPDEPRQGDLGHRSSRWPITFWRHDLEAVDEGRFLIGIIAPQHRAGIPRGGMTPAYMRSNIAVPPHIAYGSLFIESDAPYGLG